MEPFTYHLNTKVVFGCGKVREVGREARNLGIKSLVVSGPILRATGLVAQVEQNIRESGGEVCTFAKTEPNPRSSTVDEGAKFARAQGVEVIVAVGGGSVIDCAKGIAVGALIGRPIWDYIYAGPGSNPDTHSVALPLVAVPTLAASGSEFGGGAVITNWETHVKSLLLGNHIFPRVTVLDPELNVTAPRQVTGDGGLDIMAHALDNYISNTSQTPLQDRFSEGVCRTVIDYLPRAMANGKDLEARTQLAWASTMANSGILHNGRNGAGPMHFIEHTLSGLYDISHGRGLATVMPALFRYNNEGNPEKIAQIARNVFFILDENLSEKERGQKGVEALETWMKSIGMYTQLRDLGIGESDFPKIADETVRIYEWIGGSGGAILNPARRLDRAGIIQVLKLCA